MIDEGSNLAWAAGTVLSAVCLVQGLREGTAGSAMTRRRSPIWFWASMWFFAFCTAVSGYRTIMGALA